MTEGTQEEHKETATRVQGLEFIEEAPDRRELHEEHPRAMQRVPLQQRAHQYMHAGKLPKLPLE